MIRRWSHNEDCACEACERGRAEGFDHERRRAMAVAFWKLAAILEPLSPAERLETIEQLGEKLGVAADVAPMLAAARKRTLD